MWLLHCVEPRGDAFLSSLLSNDHTKKLSQNSEVLLCAVMWFVNAAGRGLVSHLCVVLPPRHTLFLPLPPEQLTRRSGVGMPRQGGGWSALSRKETITHSSALSLRFCFWKERKNKFTAEYIRSPVVPPGDHFVTPSCGWWFCCRWSDEHFCWLLHHLYSVVTGSFILLEPDLKVKQQRGSSRPTACYK